MCISAPSAPPAPPPPPPAPPLPSPPADVNTRASASGVSAQKKREQAAGALGIGGTVLTGGRGL